MLKVREARKTNPKITLTHHQNPILPQTLNTTTHIFHKHKISHHHHKHQFYMSSHPHIHWSQYTKSYSSHHCLCCLNHQSVTQNINYKKTLPQLGHVPQNLKMASTSRVEGCSLGLPRTYKKTKRYLRWDNHNT